MVGNNGQLPFGIGFPTADHRGIYTDINICRTMETTIEELAIKRTRRLVSKNNRHVEQYIKEVLKRYQDHNMYNRVAELYSRTKGGCITTEDKQEYETQDLIITEVMLKSEKLLPGKKAQAGARN